MKRDLCICGDSRIEHLRELNINNIINKVQDRCPCWSCGECEDFKLDNLVYVQKVYNERIQSK